jgi:hypothetical protein
LYTVMISDLYSTVYTLQMTDVVTLKVQGSVLDCANCHYFILFLRARGRVVVKALCCKAEGRGFDTR